MAVWKLFLPVLALTLLQSSTLEEQISAAIAKSDLEKPRLGVLVYSTKAEAPVYDRDSKKYLQLASNTKILTTAAALGTLGADYRFRTTLAWAEDSADLHVFGAGDPLISGRLHDDDPTALFRAAAKQLKELGKTKFAGNLVLHAGMFDKVYLHPAWVESGHNQAEWWCAPVGALTLNDNCVDLLYEAGEKEGDAVKVTLRPPTAYVTLVNTAKTVKGRPKDFVVDRRMGTNKVSVSGELQAGTKQRVKFIAIQDPTKYFGTVLKETLEREGVAVAGTIVESDALKLDGKVTEFILAEHTLADAVHSCNSVSQNLHAELLIKLLGFRQRGEGSWEKGAEAVRNFLKTTIGAEDVTITDGSGLARENRASPDTIVKLLNLMRTHRSGKAFVDSLAVAGEKGTLDDRMKSIAGKVRAKTGTISGVSALSGYAETASGETLVFSILVNGWKGGSPRNLQDRICEILVKGK